MTPELLLWFIYRVGQRVLDTGGMGQVVLAHAMIDAAVMSAFFMPPVGGGDAAGAASGPRAALAHITNFGASTSFAGPFYVVLRIEAPGLRERGYLRASGSLPPQQAGRVA